MLAHSLGKIGEKWVYTFCVIQRCVYILNFQEVKQTAVI
jgi:hypothetical protein